MKGLKPGRVVRSAALPALKCTHSSSGSCYKSDSDSAGLGWVARLWLLVLGPQFGELRGNLLCGGGSSPKVSVCSSPTGGLKGGHGIRSGTVDAVILFISLGTLQEMTCSILISQRDAIVPLNCRVSEKQCCQVGLLGWWPQMPPLDGTPKSWPRGP